MLLTGCSTQKNTSTTRWWHSFTARYNTYYNGSVAYIDGSLEKENGNKDNFTEIIPLYTVGNKASKELGKGNFEKAITKSQKAIKLHSITKRPEWNSNKRKTAKDKEWLSRKEYNPFLWKAWMLMGRSQFHSGNFTDAASTFSYMSRLYHTQPSIYGRARAWLAKSYIEEGWLYDAEDVIRSMQRDSIHWQAKKEWDYTFANYYIHTKEYDKAIPFLRKVIKHEMRKKQKARECFLLGQLYMATHQNDLAYKAYKKVIKLNPPYEIEFNARIAMTEVMAQKQSRQMIGILRRMARNDKNKAYLDQVYYAIGNIYLAQKDTIKAISAYENGNEKATRSGIEKGVLLLKLGDIYWQREAYSDAKRCYGEAIGLLDKERSDYEQLAERSKVLDELVPFTDAVHLQDSLQVLAKLPEVQRNEAIDRVIEELKKKEKEESDRLAEQKSMDNMADMNPFMSEEQMRMQSQNTSMRDRLQSSLWYFYNQMTVNQGKTAFQRLWGKRENTDNWQRSNRSVVAMKGGVDTQWGENDSILAVNDSIDLTEEVQDTASLDPHKREYYLAQIPFTAEQIAASNNIIMEGLFHSGVILKDKLNNLSRSEKAFMRLLNMYPTFEKKDEVYYHLYLLNARYNQMAEANLYVDKLKREFPRSKWTILLTDPYYWDNARFGKQIEDSLYAATYTAFKAGIYSEVSSNYAISTKRFPMGENRDKFMFLNGLSKLNHGDADGCLTDLDSLVTQYPESGVSKLAGMIINGVKAGMKLRGGKFDIGNVWAHRSAILNDNDTLSVREFTNERNIDFNFLVVYHPDSINENQLLFNLAKYNFTNYPVRNFDITIDVDDIGLHRMQITGFLNFDEALQYARAFHTQSNLTRLTNKARTIVISEENLALLANQHSYDDYDKFYTKHFAPLKISTFQLLNEPAELDIEHSEPTVEQIDNMLEDGTFIDNGLQREPVDDGTYIVPDVKTNESVTPRTTVVPTIAEPKMVQPVEGTAQTTVDSTVPLLPSVAKQSETSVQKQGETVIAVNPPSLPSKKPATTQQQQSKKGETIIYFGNEKSNNTTKQSVKINQPAKQDTTKKKKTEPKVIDFGDEYYDLEGF